jgi:hypothetical protein
VSRAVKVLQDGGGSEVVVIGYVIDLDLGVSVDLLKVVYGLSSVDFNSKVTVKLMQWFAGHVLYELDVVAKRYLGLCFWWRWGMRSGSQGLLGPLLLFPHR